ncbi:MAG: hypothetical protein M1834_003247 [Cirrosporium novae-zelandiae]|nr:MAG: hypothetical protein M1834_003247 [Cirrosporium novae-zelandiae]
MSPNPLLDAFATLLHRRQARSTRRRLTTTPPTSVDFSSNDYLSFSTCPAIRAAFLQELSNKGADFYLGSGGSRLLDGNSSYAESLEKDIASFHNSPAGLLFNSGFEANTGLFSCVPQPGDVIIYDEYIHASVHDGMRLSRAGRRIQFTHNSISSLRQVLQTQIDTDALIQGGKRNIFISVEGVYSMDGDVAPLADFVDCVETLLPLKNGYIIVDEAHSTGLFGSKGSGLVSDLGLEDRIFARVHTFGKALACSGDYLINYARSLIFTTAMTFPSLASIKVMYDFMSQGHTEPLTQALHALTQHLHTLLLPLSTDYPTLIRLGLEPPHSPIFPLQTPHPRSLASHCQTRGFMVRPIVAPTVPKGSERVRICLHAGNTVEEVEGLVRAVREWVEERASTEEGGTKKEGNGSRGIGEGEKMVLKSRL